MRVLFLSFYYPPDLSAGSFRSRSLVSAMLKCAPPHTEIDLVTSAPNRYASYRQEVPLQEQLPGLKITRIPLPEHRSDMLGQARAFTSFARGVVRHTAGRHYDLVFATSSRLLTATLAAHIARREGALLYLDIRDIFVDTIQDVLPRPLAWIARAIFAPLESWTMRRAQRINLVSRGFEAYFSKRYAGQTTFSWFSNGIDEEFLAAAPAVPEPRQPLGEVLIVYAGNIGKGQALHAIVPGLAARLRGRARFRIIGDGGAVELLRSELIDCTNVELHTPMTRAALLEAYLKADILFLHLGAEAAFEKVLPSKIFEYAALGRPLLAGVAGFAAEFISAEISDSAIFRPGDVEGAVVAFASLQLGTRPRREFIARYTRANIAREMAQDIFALPRRDGAAAS